MKTRAIGKERKKRRPLRNIKIIRIPMETETKIAKK